MGVGRGAVGGGGGLVGVEGSWRREGEGGGEAVEEEEEEDAKSVGVHPRGLWCLGTAWRLTQK